ncbi:hypothetical protein [Nocardia sp. NPDC004260]
MVDVSQGRLRGVFIIESFRPDAALPNLDIAVDAITRIRPASPGPEQPGIWTLVEFEAADAAAERLAATFAAALQPGPSYIDFHTADTTFVVFAGRVFRYAPGDAEARSLAVAHGREVGVSEDQLDWT